MAYLTGLEARKQKVAASALAGVSPLWKPAKLERRRSGKVRIGSQAISRFGLCAVTNGVLAAPVMIIMMLLVRRKSVVSELVIKGPVYWLGWISTAAMGLCIVGMAMSMWS